MKRLTIKETMVYGMLCKMYGMGKIPTIDKMREELKKNGLELKSNNSLTQYYEQLQKKGFVKGFVNKKSNKHINFI